MAVKIGAGDDNPAANPCCVAGKMVCGISASLFGMVFLSAGQCAIGNGDAFVPDAAITGDGSASNADWWINLEPSPDCHFSRCQSMPPDVKSWTTFFTNKFEKGTKK